MTKKEMACRIESLQRQLRELRHHTLRSALVDAADLPPCKSLACWNCQYITFITNPENGAIFLLGCGRGLHCGGFESSKEQKPTWQKRKQWLLWRMQTQFPNQSATLDETCVHVPLPPCHKEES